MRLFTVLCASSLLALASCGGGGSSSQPAPPAPPAPPVTPACVQANYTGTPDLVLLAGNMGARNITGDGPLPYALVNRPAALVFDANGSLYFLDEDRSWSRNYVRRLQNGAISTVAGTTAIRAPYADGTGRAASLPGISGNGAAVGTNGNLYVSDPASGTIRQVTPAGVVTTYAGKLGENSQVDGTLSTARFQEPRALAADQQGNLYVADRGTVRKISATGQVSTLAGSKDERSVRDGAAASARFAYVGALAVDASGTTIYIADSNTVRRLSAGTVTTVAGVEDAGSIGPLIDGKGSAARFGGADSFALDPDGTLYVADYRAVRRMTPDGTVTTLAGSNAYGYVDGHGSAAQFQGAMAIALDPQGDLWVNDLENGVLRRVTKAGDVTTAVGVPIVKGHADGHAAAATFDTPVSVAATCSGQFLVGDVGARLVSPAGAVTTAAGTSGGYHAAAALDAAGNVVASGVVNEVPGLYKYSASGATLLAKVFPRAVVYDKQGVLYFATQFQVGKIAADGTVTILAGHDQGAEMFVRWADGTGDAAYFAGLAGIAVDKDGNVFVSESKFFSKPETFSSGAIRKITPAGVVTTVAGAMITPGYVDGPGTSARFNNPGGLAFDAAGNLYIADTGNNAIRKMAPDGTVSTVIGKPEEDGYTPLYLAQVPHTGAFVPGPLPTASVLAPRALAINGNTMAITAQQGVLLLRGLP